MLNTLLLIAAGEIALTHGNNLQTDLHIRQAWDITIGVKNI
jgi:hypothetical protein